MTKSVNTGDGGGCGGTVDQNKQQIWSFLKSKGLSDVAAAGIMGNIEQESGFMPSADNSKTMGFADNGGRGCRGIVQWCHERNKKLDSFAAERGKTWDCLGVQLEYLWYELTETQESAVMKDLTAATAPYDAGNIFAEQFERMKPSEQAGRDSRSAKIYEEFTGKPASSLSSPSSGSSGCAGAGSTGAIPSADCQASVAKMNELHSSGKLKYDKDELIQKDIDHCTTQPIPRCGPEGGSHPSALRGLSAIAMNSGANSITLWNINSGHPCDEFDHPVGLASDIKECDGKAANSDEEACKKVFDYIIDHKDELNFSYVIWNGSYCQSKAATTANVSCRGDHSDHIHVSFKP